MIRIFLYSVLLLTLKDGESEGFDVGKPVGDDCEREMNNTYEYMLLVDVSFIYAK